MKVYSKTVPFSGRRFSGGDNSLMYFNSYEGFNNEEKISQKYIIGSWLEVLTPTIGDEPPFELSQKKYSKYLKNNLNHFDKLFLSTYYQSKLTQSEQLLKHGINNEQAAQMIAKEMWHHYQQGVQ